MEEADICLLTYAVWARRFCLGDAALSMGLRLSEARRAASRLVGDGFLSGGWLLEVTEAGLAACLGGLRGRWWLVARGVGGRPFAALCGGLWVAPFSWQLYDFSSPSWAVAARGWVGRAWVSAYGSSSPFRDLELCMSRLAKAAEMAESGAPLYACASAVRSAEAYLRRAAGCVGVEVRGAGAVGCWGDVIEAVEALRAEARRVEEALFSALD